MQAIETSEIGQEAREKVYHDVKNWQVGDRVAASFFRDWIKGPFRAAYMPSALGGSTTDGVLAEYVVLPPPAALEFVRSGQHFGKVIIRLR